MSKTTKKRKASGRKKRAGRKPNANQSNRHGKTALTSKESLEGSERAAEIVRARIRGQTMRDIAEDFGIAVSTVHYWLHLAAKAYRETYLEAWEELRFTTTQQLDELIAGNFGRAYLGDKDAGSIVLRALDQRSKLHGLYAEQRGKAPGQDEDPDNEFHGIADDERDRLVLEVINRARARNGLSPIEGEVVGKKRGK